MHFSLAFFWALQSLTLRWTTSCDISCFLPSYSPWKQKCVLSLWRYFCISALVLLNKWGHGVSICTIILKYLDSWNLWIERICFPCQSTFTCDAHFVLVFFTLLCLIVRMVQVLNEAPSHGRLLTGDFAFCVHKTASAGVVSGLRGHQPP